MTAHKKPPVVRVHVKGRKSCYKLLGRNALAFKVWYESTEKALQGTKVDFYEGVSGTEGISFIINPDKCPSGYTREQLEVCHLD